MNDAATQVEAFFNAYKMQKLAKGQVLWLAGDDVREVTYLVSGRVKTYDVSYRGDEIILNVFRDGAFFPMSNVLSGKKCEFIYEAETDCEVRRAPAKAVVEMLKENNVVLFDLLTRVYSGMDGVLGRMSHLMAGSARSRLLYELLIEMKRFGEHRPDGSCSITVSEKELGARAGLTRETISREMHKLKDAHLISVRPKDMLIHNTQELLESLGSDF